MRQLWLLDFWIYRRSLGEKNQAFERAIRNRPKGYRAGLESGKSLYRKGVSQMLEEFAEKVIKNKLMARAIDGTPYEAAANMLKGPNMWFFIEDDIKGTMTAYKDFLKEANKKETHPILGGVMEATAYDTQGVEAIGQLPTKSELYAKIAASIQAVPTKVARVIKAPGSKLARAIKLATMPENKD